MSDDFNDNVQRGITIRQQAALMMAQALAPLAVESSDESLARAAVELADAVLKREAETRGRSDE